MFNSTSLFENMKYRMFEYIGVIGLFLAIELYLTKFDEYSETELVRWSYLWLPMIVFGAVGYHYLQQKKKEESLQKAFEYAFVRAGLWTLGIAFGLMAFYELIWDSL